MIIEIAVCFDNFDASDAAIKNGLERATLALEDEFQGLDKLEISTKILYNSTSGYVRCSMLEHEERVNQVLDSIWEQTNWWEPVIHGENE